jgi:hypothetical protein
MKLCPKCSSTPWPFLLVIFIAVVSAFLTWLTLSYSGVGTVGVIAGSGGVFVAVLATLLHYVISCLKRHCRHGNESGHDHGHHSGTNASGPSGHPVA